MTPTFSTFRFLDYALHINGRKCFGELLARMYGAKFFSCRVEGTGLFQCDGFCVKDYIQKLLSTVLQIEFGSSWPQRDMYKNYDRPFSK